MSDIAIIADDEIIINIGAPTSDSGSETDPTVPAHVKAITTQNIADWNAKADAASVTTEATARAAADTTLQNNITAEASTRSSADTALQNNITAEASTRATADTSLQNSIVAEGAARVSADNALQLDINNRLLKSDFIGRVLTADISNSTTSLVDVLNTINTISDLHIPMGINDIWEFEISGVINPASNTGARLGISIPAGAELTGYVLGSTSSNQAFREVPLPAAGGEIASTMWSQTATDLIFHIKGTIFNSDNAGNAQFKFRSASAGVSITMKKGTNLCARKLT